MKVDKSDKSVRVIPSHSMPLSERNIRLSAHNRIKVIRSIKAGKIRMIQTKQRR